MLGEGRLTWVQKPEESRGFWLPGAWNSIDAGNQTQVLGKSLTFKPLSSTICSFQIELSILLPLLLPSYVSVVSTRFLSFGVIVKAPISNQVLRSTLCFVLIVLWFWLYLGLWSISNSCWYEMWGIWLYVTVYDCMRLLPSLITYASIFSCHQLFFFIQVREVRFSTIGLFLEPSSDQGVLLSSL